MKLHIGKNHMNHKKIISMVLLPIIFLLIYVNNLGNISEKRIDGEWNKKIWYWRDF